MLTLQKKLNDIFYEKPKSEIINVVQISADLKKISAFPDSQLNLFNNNPYFFKGILSKSMYAKVSNYYSFKILFRKLKLILCWPLQYKTKISKECPILDRETWALILRSSQEHYPIKKLKSWKTLQLQGIKVIAPSLTEKDASDEFSRPDTGKVCMVGTPQLHRHC